MSVLRRLNIWLVTTGEPLPSDGPDVRLLRVGIFFKELLARGHEVRWWTSDFDHQHRVHRTDTPNEVAWGPGGGEPRGRITLLPSPGYGPSISLKRIWDHRVTAARFLRAARRAARPDVVVCSYPTIELSRAAVEYGIETGVPVLLDIRDLWPDVIWDTVAPGVGGRVRDLALWPLRRPAAWAVRNASAVTGLTESYVDWACALARRPRGPWDRPVSLTYPVQADLNPLEVVEGAAYWKGLGVDLERHWVVSFLGTLGRQFDFGPVLEAARALRPEAPDIRFVLCGNGEGLEPLRAQASGLDSVVMPGWVEGPARRLLLGRSRVGLGPYVTTENFKRNLPNKPVEYFAYGLPVAHALEGVLDEVCARSGAGVRYGAGSGAPDLADVLRALRADEVRRSSMADAAHRLFQEEFRPDAVTDRLVALCHDLVTGRPAR